MIDVPELFCIKVVTTLKNLSPKDKSCLQTFEGTAINLSRLPTKNDYNSCLLLIARNDKRVVSTISNGNG